MADGIEFDFSEILALSADLGKAPAKAGANIVKAVAVTAKRVKEDWQEPWRGSEHVPGAPPSISYELKGAASIFGSAISAEIGPEIGGPGALAGMLEYGTPNTGARGYGAEALHRNEADFVEGITKAGEIDL